jgi:hypothetical protein
VLARRRTDEQVQILVDRIDARGRHVCVADGLHLRELDDTWLVIRRSATSPHRALPRVESFLSLNSRSLPSSRSFLAFR